MSSIRTLPRLRAPRAAVLAALLTALAACGRGEREAPASDASTAVRVVDDAGETVRLERPARRIVSLIPSATDLLVAIGARGQVAGRTDFDKDPAVASLPSVGGGLDPSLETLAALRPDLVLTWESSADGALRTRLRELGIPAYAVSANDTADVFRTLANLGTLAGRRPSADSAAAAIRAELEAVRRSVAGRPAPGVLYVGWVDPPMVAGSTSFIADLIRVAGGRPLFEDVRQEWPQVSLEEIVSRRPEVVVIPTGEGAQFSAAALRGLPGWRELGAFRAGRVHEVPVEVVNRPGPRLGEAARLLRDAIHSAPAGR